MYLTSRYIFTFITFYLNIRIEFEISVLIVLKELVRGMMAIISVTNDVAQQKAQCQVNYENCFEHHHTFKQ